MNSHLFLLLLALAISPSTFAWDLGTSFHTSPLYADHCPGHVNTSAPCDLVSLHTHCLRQLSQPPSALFSLHLQPHNLTDTSSLDLRSQCCTAWALLDCLNTQICQQCGTKALELARKQHLAPLRTALQAGHCHSYPIDSVHCYCSQFWLYGTVFIVLALATSLGIFLYSTIQQRRNQSTPYQIFH